MAWSRSQRGQDSTVLRCLLLFRQGSNGPPLLPGTDYRTKEEVESWKCRCPIKTFRERAKASGLIAEEQFAETRCCSRDGRDLPDRSKS
jgi:TPP-dependent pyruvate/acetoin dehydrogenase alpha subunit